MSPEIAQTLSEAKDPLLRAIAAGHAALLVTGNVHDFTLAGQEILYRPQLITDLLHEQGYTVIRYSRSLGGRIHNYSGLDPKEKQAIDSRLRAVGLLQLVNLEGQNGPEEIRNFFRTVARLLQLQAVEAKPVAVIIDYAEHLAPAVHTSAAAPDESTFVAESLHTLANAPALRKIADRHGLFLIQDCAQSFGAYRGETHTGGWADVAVFSFTWGKALFAGEGGLIVTRHPELLERLVWQTQHPHRQLRDVPDLPANEMAMNLRIHPLSAVWADAAFNDALAGIDEHRHECVQILNLLEKEQMSRTKAPDGQHVKPSFHALTFEPRCDPGKIEHLLWESNLLYRLCSPPIIEPLYRHESYRKASLLNGWDRPDRCPAAERQFRRRLRLVKSNVSPRPSSSFMSNRRFTRSQAMESNSLFILPFTLHCSLLPTPV